MWATTANLTSSPKRYTDELDMKRLTLIVFCFLVMSCRESTISPTVDQGLITVFFNGHEVKFEKPYIHAKAKTNDGSNEYLTAAIYDEKNIDSIKNSNHLRYSTTIVFTEDLGAMKYKVRQINFSIAAFDNDKLKNINDFTTELPRSDVSFHFTTNRTGKAVGIFHGTLFNPNSSIIPQLVNKDSTLEVSGQFNLNFDPIQHTP
jgi:hypothetical protein